MVAVGRELCGGLARHSDTPRSRCEPRAWSPVCAGQEGASRMAARRRRRKGHTVLELMVVIAIIVTLLAMYMPSYVRAVKMARGVAAGTR